VTLPPHTVAERLSRVRATIAAARLDALVVTHLPNVQYLTGFAGSAGIALVLPLTCLLVVDFRYVTAAEALTAPLGGHVTLATFERSYDEAVVELLRRERVQRIGIEAAYLPVARFNTISAALAAGGSAPGMTSAVPQLVATERLVERVRVIKDGAEIATLREAGHRLAGIAQRVHTFVRAGRTEMSIALEIDDAMRSAGFSRPAFETIVASGPNSALPHARPTSRELREGDPTVLDFGGVYDGYCVDLTRTVQLGPATPALRALYEAVAEAQEAAIAAVRPGVASGDIDAAARKVLGKHGLAEAFGHGTGHGLGLEVHEDPRIARKSARQLETIVEPGMVFTIEPGAYVPGIGGVRIEDDVLVTDRGCDVITRWNAGD
jgi:Xaa-Pro aminopeptidase